MSANEEAIFYRAIELPGEERHPYLLEACGNDLTQVHRLQQLLAAHESDQHFLDLVEHHGSSSEISLSEGDQIGPYVLTRKLGEGGFGIVFLAEQTHPIQRQVAVKVIKPGVDSKAVIARFENERQALAMMNHPNIAKVFDGGTSENTQRPYFVMEWVDGVPITEFCDQHQLPLRERLELFVAVCNAVHHAHQKGIIHRDLKPGNVLVASHDGLPNIKVIDFGVAKAVHHHRQDQQSILDQNLIGTPQYMSPEQAQVSEGDVDTRSDIYSLTVLLFELATGSTPIERSKFRNVTFGEMQRLIKTTVAPRPSSRLQNENSPLIAKQRRTKSSQLARKLKSDLDWVCLKGLAKNRDERYSSAKELADDIQRILSHHPVLAVPPSLVYSTKKFGKRNAWSLVLVAATVAILAATSWAILNHQRHRRAAIAKDENQLNQLVDEANVKLAQSIESPDADESWTEANLLVDQIQDLLSDSLANPTTVSRAHSFIDQFYRAQQSREFSQAMERLLVQHATNPTPNSLQSLKTELVRILRDRGYDVEAMPPQQVADRLRQDHEPVKLTDALELWINTRMKIAATDSSEIQESNIKQWTEAMNASDPSPLRAVIRETIFQTIDANRDTLDQAVSQDDLKNMCARKLSWLALAYQLAAAPDRADEIREFALNQYADDLILNFDHAMRLREQGQTEAAIQYLMRCTSIRPKIPDVWKRLAETLHENGEFERAQKTVQVAIKLAPGDAYARLLLARLQLKNKQHREAIATANQAQSLNPNLNAWTVIGQAHMNRGEFKLALTAFQSALRNADPKKAPQLQTWIQNCKKLIANRDGKRVGQVHE